MNKRRRVALKKRRKTRERLKAKAKALQATTPSSPPRRASAS
ncbi:MAG TPA: hypothetical protein VHS99_03650 [Chloroflexota bacterium]|jgi:hypothetical protein|nr:hypothetical protein [Chloroflexota bacterium]